MEEIIIIIRIQILYAKIKCCDLICQACEKIERFLYKFTTHNWPAEECVREEEKMFANLVVELKKHHYSQRGLAAYIGISESSMNDKMNGRTQFTMREAKAIQAVFEGRTLDYLFEEKE